MLDFGVQFQNKPCVFSSEVPEKQTISMTRVGRIVQNIAVHPWASPCLSDRSKKSTTLMNSSVLQVSFYPAIWQPSLTLIMFVLVLSSPAGRLLEVNLLLTKVSSWLKHHWVYVLCEPFYSRVCMFINNFYSPFHKVGEILCFHAWATACYPWGGGHWPKNNPRRLGTGKKIGPNGICSPKKWGSKRSKYYQN